MKALFLSLFFAISLLYHGFSFAIDSQAIEQLADESIKKLYHRLNTIPNHSMPQRINWISQQFLGTVYILGALGEGPNARYDQYPQYRVDGFDCDTYVNTIVSLALANSLESFQHCIRKMRYHDGLVDYIERNHFTSIDWNKNNQKLGILKDITLEIKNKHHQSVALFAHAIINKPGWYAHKTLDTIRLQKENHSMSSKRLAELKTKGKKLHITRSKIPYIPLTALFPKDHQPDEYLFSQIPSGAVVEIIRPNWDLRKQIGTALNVSHLGFVIKKKNQLYFRQASSTQGMVVDVPLIDYLKQALQSPTIKGINVQIILPKKPLNATCQVHP